VRSVNITWNFDNALCGSAVGSGTGLTERGREFVRAAQEAGVILDMSHLSERGFWDVLEEAGKPVYASHSDSLALAAGVKRNLSDDQFMALMRCGGGAGINLCPDFLGLGRDMDAVCAHIEHYLELGGEKAVFLGTDFDGIEETPKGISGVSDMPELYEALLRRNYPEGLVRDIFITTIFWTFWRGRCEHTDIRQKQVLRHEKGPALVQGAPGKIPVHRHATASA
jgi:membrane dipeptidase